MTFMWCHRNGCGACYEFRAWCMHDDIIKWKHFPRYWPFVWGIHWSPVNSPHRGQWRGALMLSLICARINGWVNNCEGWFETPSCSLWHHSNVHSTFVTAMLYAISCNITQWLTTLLKDPTVLWQSIMDFLNYSNRVNWYISIIFNEYLLFRLINITSISHQNTTKNGLILAEVFLMKWKAHSICWDYYKPNLRRPPQAFDVGDKNIHINAHLQYQ